MKKLKVLGLAAIAAGMFSLTSCLNGGGNQQTFPNTLAIVDYSPTFRILLYPIGVPPVYIPTVANDTKYSAGDCVLTAFSIDYDSADNANAATNGFYVATGAASSPLPKYDLSFSASDSIALDNELLLMGAESGMMFSNSYKRVAFLPVFASASTEQKNEYRAMMDYSQEPETVDGIERVYTVCVRARKLEDGKAPTLTNVSDVFVTEGASFYNMLKNKEAAAGKKIVSYRVKYPLTFNSDSTKIATWGFSKISQFSIEETEN